jgi:TPP-dependent pyruvate/acetoin dehydrogenase alpha subunit
MVMREELVESIDSAVLLRMLRQMYVIRAFDSQLPLLYTKGLIRGSSHAAIGQEAVAVGACAALSEEDYITSTHRGHGHAIAKGADVRRMMAELFGRAEGYCGGKGGSMHIADFAIGMLGANGIVGGGLGIATGAALSAQLRQSGQVTLCFFGDGALNQGSFLECGNLAAIWQLPLVLLCENNQYAMSAKVDEMTACGNGDLSERGRAFGIPAIEVDGMDVLAVYGAVRHAVDRARAGFGPSFLAAKCYRFEGHFAGDTMRYRAKEEAASWLVRDPVNLYRDRLVGSGIVSAEEVQELELDAGRLIHDAVDYAANCPQPPPETAWTDVVD